MIRSIKIKNFAIIEDMEIEFSKSMNILLGETGAGKSIIIDAIALLSGARADYDKIRFGQSKAYIEGIINLTNDKVKTLLDTNDIPFENDEILISRTLERTKSVCRINNITIPQSLLKSIMDNLIDIHSQHKDNSFFDESKQLDFLDLYLIKNKNVGDKNYELLLDKYSNKYKEYHQELKKIKALYDKKSNLEDIDYLKHQIAEIEKVELKENEIEDIDEELNRLNSFSKIYNAFKSYQENFQLASNYLYSARKDLTNLKDNQFDEMVERFENCYYELDDCNSSLEKEFNKLENSLERIEYLNARKIELNTLKRKYGRTTKQIIDAYQELKDSLDLIENFDYLIDSQNRLIEQLNHELVDLANIIHENRVKAKSQLEADMNQNLKDIALENAEFMVDLSTQNFNEKGIDKVNFLIRANIGQNFLSIKDSASLGETSRINLAYKLVFNNLEMVDTIIFDEIDTGISSHVAVVVAKKIKELSNICQTIIITHLPQMAAIGDKILFVSKKVENDNTRTSIKTLNDEEKMVEISKMISGKEINEITLKAAKELINSMRS